MHNGGKYVPPALRGSTAGAPEGDDRSEGQARPFRRQFDDDEGRGGGYGGRGGGGFNRGGGYDNNGYGGRGGGYQQRDFYGGGGGGAAGGRGYPRRDFGGDNYGGRDGGYGYGGGRDSGYGGRDAGYGGGGGGGGGYRSGPRKNELGFHGDMRANPRVEEELFFKNETQTTGINFDKYDDIPVEVSAGCPEPYNEFTVDTIGPQLLKNLVLTKFTKPTPVQKYSIPIGMAGGDMMACAQTGSGKTAGFLFPVISMMLRLGPLPEPESRRGKSTAYVSTLILAPTRELAVQIHEEAQKFCYCTGIRPVVVYGGANIQNQQRELDYGADILVATPGRLVDLIERGRVNLCNVRFLVLDEADRMLDMGFEPQIRRIVESEGMPVDRQTFMFSATFPQEIQRLAGDFMRNYVFVAVGRVGSASKDVTQKVEWIEHNDKMDFVVDFLSRISDGLVLIFVETKRGADYLEEVLTRHNFPASSIHGDKSQREREDALKSFKSGRTPILVATDVAARGLDIPNVTQVINFDLPSNIDDYVHRIGRTGRAGNVGHALSLINDKNRNIAKELAELLVENQQELPGFMERYLGNHYNSGGGRGGRGYGGRGGRGAPRFGARDVRRDQHHDGGHSSGGRGAPGRGAPAGRGGGGFSSGGGFRSGGADFPRHEAWAEGDNSAW